MNKLLFYIALILVLSSCQKAEERTCFKSHGEETSIEMSLDSTNSFVLNKKMKFRIFEDTLKKVIIKGGENMVGLIDVTTENYETTVTNQSKCHFLRDSDRIVEVEIHYPSFEKFKLLTSDSVLFENTIYSDNLEIELYESGSSLQIDVDNNYIYIVVSRGTADYVLTGRSNSAAIKIQDNGFADASGFRANQVFAFQGSTANLKLNLDTTDALILIDGSGDVFYSGTPDSLNLIGAGSGKLIPN